MRIKTTAKQLERLASWGYLKQMADGSWTIVLQNDFERWSEEYFSEIARQCGILFKIRSFGVKSCPLLAYRQLVGDFCNTIGP